MINALSILFSNSLIFPFKGNVPYIRPRFQNDFALIIFHLTALEGSAPWAVSSFRSRKGGRLISMVLIRYNKSSRKVLFSTFFNIAVGCRDDSYV
jgi:hypothetical protein